MANIDQFSDPAYATLTNHLHAMPAFAEFVKSAEIAPDEADTLPDTAFAWPSERRYPIHNEKHAALSYAYAKDAKVPRDVTERLKEALEVYGIDVEMFQSTEKIASSPGTYLLPKYNAILVKTASDIPLAQVMLLETFSKLSMETKVEACVTLAEKAAEFNVKLHPIVRKYAGHHLPAEGFAVKRALEVRAAATKLTPFREAYDSLSEAVEKQARLSESEAAKFAAQLYELDKRAGLVTHYDTKLPDPINVVYGDKVASEMIDLNGRMVTAAALAKVNPQVWEELMGKEGWDEMAPSGALDPVKMAEVVRTLPMDLKAILASQVR